MYMCVVLFSIKCLVGSNVMGGKWCSKIMYIIHLVAKNITLKSVHPKRYSRYECHMSYCGEGKRLNERRRKIRKIWIGRHIDGCDDGYWLCSNFLFGIICIVI